MIEKNIYDNIDPEGYEKRRNKNQKEKYLYEHWKPIISSAIAKYSKDSVALDLGCGTGNHCFEIARYAKQVSGIDSSEKMLGYAKKKYPGINFIYSDATNTPIENGCIDFVFSFGLFEYIKNKEDLVKEMSRVLRAGGMGVIVASNKYSFPQFLAVMFYAASGRKLERVGPSFGQMMKMFNIFDFEILEYKMDDGLFYLPGRLDKFFGEKTFLFVERCFKIFKRNFFSTGMFFVIKKKKLK